MFSLTKPNGVKPARTAPTVAHPLLPRLLAILAALSSGLAEEGRPKERAIQRAVEDLQDLLQQPGLDEAVHGRIKGAIMKLECTLRSSTPIDALKQLSKAAAALSAVAPRPKFPRLPTELLTIIIAYAQSPAPHFQDRQRTNLSLSLVSRQFHQLVRPRLLGEIHLFDERQLVGLDKMRRKRPDRAKDVHLLTVDLQLTRLHYRPNDIWYGYLLQPVLEWLGATKEIHLTFDGIDMDATGVHPYLERVFGQSWDLPGFFERREGVEEAHLALPGTTTYTEACRYHTIVTPGSQLRRLYVITSPGMREITELLREEFDETVEFERHPWEVLCAPHAAFFISSLSALLPLGPSRLSHLEITLVLPSNEPLVTRLLTLKTLFTQLAPSLRRLALRIRHMAWHDRQAVSLAIEEGVSTLIHLHTLSIGGSGLSRSLSAASYRRSSLTSLTLLPLQRQPEDGVLVGALHDHIDGNRGLVRVLANKKWFAKLRWLEVQRGPNQRPSAMLKRMCEQRGIELRMPMVDTLS
ncbi:hypothetical protein BCR35DRAFT_298602 [Leucosporidium creatinivorum]|uniref:F-box domain-containing protein n=1 Tax=Leucosporidium creatinivorum TaxID=106004 RepID=A0A1Y2G4W4_9BASI|nr:hypothetical protein BCR35DRAFT_298602 [Leucosporidium creatinivorum]